MRAAFKAPLPSNHVCVCELVFITSLGPTEAFCQPSEDLKAKLVHYVGAVILS